jgi:hypothetical protein
MAGLANGQHSLCHDQCSPADGQTHGQPSLWPAQRMAGQVHVVTDHIQPSPTPAQTMASQVDGQTRT